MILGIKQVFGYASSNHYQYSVTGSFFNPGPFGGYLVFIFALSLGIVAKMWKKDEDFLNAIKQRQFNELINIDYPLYFVAFAALVLSFILLPASMSRSAWMAACVVALLAVIEMGALKGVKNWFSTGRLGRVISKCKRLFVPLAFILAGVVVAVIFGVYSLKKESADSRLFSWQISAKVIADKPVTGVGVGYFGGTYAKQQVQYFDENPESKYLYVADCPTYAFNEYLQIGTELGVVGLVLFGIVIILALRPHPRPLSKGEGGSQLNPFRYGLIAILVFAFTSYPFHLVPLLVLFVVSVAAQSPHPQPLLPSASPSGFKRRGEALPGKLTGKIVFAVISVVVFAVWTGTRPMMNDYIKAQKEWQKLQALYRMETYDTAGYEEFYSVLKFDHKFLFEYGHSLNKVGEYEKSNEILRQGTELSNDPMFHNIVGNNYLALKEYEYAEKSYETAYHIVPSRIYPCYLLAKLYIEQGDHAKALDMCRKVMEFRPKIHTLAVMEIKEEIEELMYSFDTQSQN
jgi:hypothetical protein